jgi:hypothetical protein
MRASLDGLIESLGQDPSLPTDLAARQDEYLGSPINGFH